MPAFDLKSLFRARLGENYELHEQHINPTLVQVQRIIGFDKVYARAEGAYLYDEQGNDYLDFLSGYSTYNIGRNHPVVKKALHDALDLDLPNMVQMDCSLMSGLLAEALLKKCPRHLDAVFFCNSGTEANEGAIKFARAATGRSRLIALKGSFHGLSNGSLSLTAAGNFQEGFGDLLPGVAHVKLGDLTALEEELRSRDVAAFIIEPIQGKGVVFPEDDYFLQAEALCRRYGTLLIADEVQTGLGRTGKWWGHAHFAIEPDIMTVAKSLSGGYVPVGAIVTRRSIYQKTFSSLDRCVVHSTTFGRNNLAMVAGLASLSVLENEGLIENAAKRGTQLMERIDALRAKHPVIRAVRGKGLMIAIEFAEPPGLTGKLAWRAMHKMDGGLFIQTVVVPLMSKHRVLTLVAGHNMDVIKILPPLTIGEKEIERFVQSLDATLTALRRPVGPIVELTRNLMRQKSKERKGEKRRKELAGV